jgi:hypothetical protein
MTDQDAPVPTFHRGTDRPHVPATSTELARVELPSGRVLIYRHIRYGYGHALDVVVVREGREHNVRVPLGGLEELRRAIHTVEDAARDAATARPIVVGARGVPRGRTAPPPARVPPLPPTHRPR